MKRRQSSSKPYRSTKSQTYWVLQRKQLRTLVSQRRLEIIDRLVAAGPLAAKELARLVGAQPSALYHYLQQLMRVGLVVEAGYRVVRRRREVLYMTRAPRIRLFRVPSASTATRPMEPGRWALQTAGRPTCSATVC